MPDGGSTDEGTFSAERLVGLRLDLPMMPNWSWIVAETGRAQIAAAGCRWHCTT